MFQIKPCHRPVWPHLGLGSQATQCMDGMVTSRGHCAQKLSGCGYVELLISLACTDSLNEFVNWGMKLFVLFCCLAGFALIECDPSNINKSIFTAISKLLRYTWPICWQQTDIDCDHWCLLISFLRKLNHSQIWTGLYLCQFVKSDSSWSCWHGKIIHSSAGIVYVCVFIRTNRLVWLHHHPLPHFGPQPKGNW